MPNELSDNQTPLQTIAPYMEAFRLVLIRILIVSGICSVGGYYCTKPVLVHLQRITGAKLVSYGLPDAFFAFIMLAIAIGLAASLPYAFYALLSTISVLFPQFTRMAVMGFWSAAILLFAAGILFCVEISLPYGSQFLLSFETDKITALISAKAFVSFCIWVIFGFGLIFELPLVMMLSARIGLADPVKLAGYRRYILVAIMIIAAVLTPTPDILNMLLMAAPLYLLFEIGLVGMRFWRKK